MPQPNYEVLVEPLVASRHLLSAASLHRTGSEVALAGSQFAVKGVPLMTHPPLRGCSRGVSPALLHPPRQKKQLVCCTSASSYTSGNNYNFVSTSRLIGGGPTGAPTKAPTAPTGAPTPPPTEQLWCNFADIVLGGGLTLSDTYDDDGNQYNYWITKSTDASLGTCGEDSQLKPGAVCELDTAAMPGSPTCGSVLAQCDYNTASTEAVWTPGNLGCVTAAPTVAPTHASCLVADLTLDGATTACGASVVDGTNCVFTKPDGACKLSGETT